MIEETYDNVTNKFNTRGALHLRTMGFQSQSSF